MNTVQATKRGLLWKKIVAAITLIASLVAGGNVTARVPEDFMTSPTLLFPTNNSTVSRDEFVLKGLAYNYAFVDIFIDGNPAGRATTKNSPKGVASFYFKPAKISKGLHWVQALVRSEHEVFRSPLTLSVMVEVTDPTPAPTLLTFADSGDYQRPFIRGVAKNNTTVTIAINGKVDQEFFIEEPGKDTVAFSVKPTKSLPPGFHAVWAVSTSRLGVQSKRSNTRTFLVAESRSKIVNKAAGMTETPSTGFSEPKAPTLVAPQTGTIVTSRRPTITGFAHNDLLIKTFVDDTFEKEFKVQNHPSGTTRFTFLPANALKSGDHRVSVIAEDASGNKSSRSNELAFLVRPEGSVPVFTPRGVSSKWYPPLPPSPRGTTTIPTTPVGAKPKPGVEGVTDQKPEGVNVNVNIPREEIEKAGEKAPLATRKVIGWIILGISVLGIIAYIVAAVLEKKRKGGEVKSTPTQPKGDFTPTSQPPSEPRPEENQLFMRPKEPPAGPPFESAPPPPDIPDLDDDIPKGYQ